MNVLQYTQVDYPKDFTSAGSSSENKYLKCKTKTKQVKMSVNSVLMDFSIDAQRISDESSRKDITKTIIENLSKYFENLSFVYEMLCDDGSMSILSDKTGTILTIRYFNEGLITINIEYYKKEGAQAKISFEVSIMLLTIVFDRCSCKTYVNNYISCN